METLKLFFTQYGQSFLVMVITGLVIALILELTVKKAIAWLEGKLAGHEKILAVVQCVKAFAIQFATWIMVVLFLGLIIDSMPLPAGKVLYPVWLCLEYIIQYLFSCWGIKGVQTWIARNAEKALEKKTEPEKPVLYRVEGVKGLFKDAEGNYFNAKGEPVEV